MSLVSLSFPEKNLNSSIRPTNPPEKLTLTSLLRLCVNLEELPIYTFAFLNSWLEKFKFKIFISPIIVTSEEDLFISLPLTYK